MWPPRIGADVMRMSDSELIAALAIIRDGPAESTKLTDWERTFVESLPRIWERHGTITWKQRKGARHLIRKVHDRVERNVEHHSLIAHPPAEPTVPEEPGGPPRVVAAAIRTESGEVFSVPVPGRHNDVIRLMGATFNQSDEQGFLLSDGRFARRKAAYVVAVTAGQLNDGDGVAPQHGLFSEDLW